MELIVFGLNHRTAPLEARESWALSAAQTETALLDLSGRVPNSEHVILSTCNRTEFYSYLPIAKSPLGTVGAFSSDDPNAPPVLGVAELCAEPARSSYEFLRRATPDALGFYREIRRVVDDTSFPEDPSHFYVHRQQGAVEHLFRLVAGLDSMIVGEAQILGQVKDAYTAAQQAGTTGVFFHDLFRTALRLGKRVRTATVISDGCITPGQAALKLARATIGDLTQRTVLVIGSGEIAELTVRAVAEAGIGRCVVVNRTPGRARELVDALGVGEPAAWEHLDCLLEVSDLVISSTAAVDPIVDRERVEIVQARRGGKPFVVVDLAIPRDFEPEVAEIEGVSVFNIDDLNGVIQENVDHRIQQVPEVERLINDELASFRSNVVYRKVDPVLKHLVQRFEQIRLGVVQQFVGLFPAEQHESVDQLTSALTKKLLHFPIEKLKALRSLHNLTDREAQFLNRLFLAEPPPYRDDAQSSLEFDRDRKRGDDEPSS